MRSADGAGEDQEEGARAESPFRTGDTIDPFLHLLRCPTLFAISRRLVVSRRRVSNPSLPHGEKLFCVYVSLLRARKRTPTVNPDETGDEEANLELRRARGEDAVREKNRATRTEFEKEGKLRKFYRARTAIGLSGIKIKSDQQPDVENFGYKMQSTVKD